ncbi:MAG: hypothetical protein A3G27_06680 [Betaproteobacteria bacterium RIFCSPLOWO2_12_FULL_66_14]|nr:MAG: hypothetical protein A3G27_06680 [Betaproteobacteria bacterium RIFCSPLOWO2_12_FULL_66_14]
MHLELVVPALFPAYEAPSTAAPALEMLLARGRGKPGDAASLERWLCRAFGLSGVPAGALTALAHGLDPGTRRWLRADPVHLRAARDHLVLVPNQAFAVTGAEADALAAKLAPLLAGKFTLYTPKPDQWCLRIEHPDESDASAEAPIEIAGASIDPHLFAKQWHALLTELEMALHAHPVNTAREARGDPAINSLWLWGAGTQPAAARSAWQSVSADDPVALGLARLAAIRHRAPGSGAEEWLGRAPEDGRHLVVLDGLRSARAPGDLEAFARRLQALEDGWFAPLHAALKAGRVGMVTVHVPDAAASFETVRADLRRFWRRPRPLASYRITLP